MVRLPLDLIAAVAEDAKAKGQTLSVWHTRAAAAYLTAQRARDEEIAAALALAASIKNTPAAAPPAAIPRPKSRAA